MTKVKSTVLKLFVSMVASLLLTLCMAVPGSFFDNSITASAASVSLAAPKNPVVTLGTDYAYFKWDPVKNAEAYIVYLKSPGSEEYVKYKTVSNEACNIKELKIGTKYIIKVTPITLTEKSTVESRGKSALWSFTTKAYTDKVKNVSVSYNDDETYLFQYDVVLKWDAIASADSYKVLYKRNKTDDKYIDITNKFTFSKKDGMIIATGNTGNFIKGGIKYTFQIVPVKNIKGKLYDGGKKAIAVTAPTPKLTDFFESDTIDDVAYHKGNYVYQSFGTYNCFTGFLSVYYHLVLNGCVVEDTSSEDLGKYSVYYKTVSFGEVDIGQVVITLDDYNGYNYTFAIYDY